MPTYIMLANWTEQGAQKVKDSPRRLETAKKALFDMGGEFKAFYMTLGRIRSCRRLRSPGRCGGSTVQPVARDARQRADEDAEGLSRGGLPRDHRLARLTSEETSHDLEDTPAA